MRIMGLSVIVAANGLWICEKWVYLLADNMMDRCVKPIHKIKE